MTTSNYKPQDYKAPQVDVLALVVEQCIASSTGIREGNLEDMDEHSIYDEIF